LYLHKYLHPIYNRCPTIFSPVYDVDAIPEFDDVGGAPLTLGKKIAFFSDVSEEYVGTPSGLSALASMIIDHRSLINHPRRCDIVLLSSQL